MSPDELPRIAHDPDAFEAFYRAHVVAVERFMARRVDDPHLVADLTAEVFLAAIDSADTYRPSRGPAIAWLFGIARTTVASTRRRAARERHANARVSGQRLLDPDDVSRIQDRIDAAAQARTVLAAIADLPEGERAVLELVALDELSVTDAARALRIRPVAARVRLHRARATLRRELSDPDTPTLAPMEA